MGDNVETATKAFRRSKDEKKVLRKQIKASHTLLKHEGIHTTSKPTKHLVVINGGLGNGVSREHLSATLEEMGELEVLVMPPHKPYAFVTYSSEENTLKAHITLNGHMLQCGENCVTLYLCFVESVKDMVDETVNLPEGLTVLDDFVSPEEEAQLLSSIDWSSICEQDTAQKALKHRKVKHYGYEFRYDNNNVDKDKPLAAGLPVECMPVLERCIKRGCISVMPDQLTVNQYESGQGIPPHIDTHSPFEDTIMSLSLGAQTVMEFRHPDGRLVAVVLPSRSLLVMKGESRYLWTHGITPRKFDMVPAADSECPIRTVSNLTQRNLTLSKRDTRTSFTFRKIRHEPCNCAFPSACDSQGAHSSPKQSQPAPPSLPGCHADAAHLEQQYVHQVYDAIASHFSSTRHSPWPRVCDFLCSLPPGSVLADVGCGNGKYLGVNPQLVAMGCDRSSGLIHICAERGFQVFVSDALSVPLRTASCDACISIAVIHHFSTQERRLEAIKELVRLLKPGGQALIYVWAFEQEYNKQKSKYLKDSKENQGATVSISTEQHKSSGQSSVQTSKRFEEDNEIEQSMSSPEKVTQGKLSVHTNRTSFNTQDLLVPWHLKDGKREVGERENVKEETQKSSSGSNKTYNEDNSNPIKSDNSSAPVFHRYYHVFQKGELEKLCGQVAGVKVQSSSHDQGNWCVILLKDL
ncbi:tRNA (carboxymethyluridine(34)-5-O)-methyltransferase alkbh8 [Eucyclogobius newberryi]|uniref:tRNA (carboxymethyluridine(34)-5-O)-methyltransferase alkbh8 n=1 Tax=Eucyclogobius newberryi TaxID=166745 RepID=UPI003B5A146B